MKDDHDCPGDNMQPQEATAKILRRLVEALILGEISDHTHRRTDHAMSFEVMASILRRILRDVGMEKEAVKHMQGIASKLAEEIYEASGMGKEVRAMRVRAEAAEQAKPDSEFSKEEWNRAGEVMGDAIGRIWSSKNSSNNDN